MLLDIFRTFVSLKKTATILFLFVFLCGSTELHELLKLPILVHHYMEHIAQYNNESLIDFLDEHYADKIAHDDDIHHDHQNLPFKTNDCATIFMFVANPTPTTHFHAHKAFWDNEQQLIAQTTTFVSSSILDNIFQPPKF